MTDFDTGPSGAVAAAVEAVTLGFAAGVFNRADAAERAEGSFAGEPVGVVARGGEELGGADGSDAGTCQ